MHAQGLELALRSMNAGGAFTFGTLQAGKPAACRYQPERGADGQLTHPEEFERFIRGVHNYGAPLSPTETRNSDFHHRSATRCAACPHGEVRAPN